MRWNGFLLASLFMAAALSGCLGGDDDKETEPLQSTECPTDDLAGGLEGDAAQEDAADDDGALDDLDGTLAALRTRQAENETLDDGAGTDVSATTEALDPCAEETPSLPNTPPTANLVMTADDGAVQDGTTYIMAGQNVTFSAAGSMDDDGSIQLAALTVRDSNSTRTMQLFADGFQDLPVSFPHEGPVNVTLRVLDDDGDVDVLEAMLYVNRIQSLVVPIDIPLPAGHGAGGCDYPTEPPLLWQRSMNFARFVVNSGAQWISAEMTGGSGEFALCDPANAPISEASTEAAQTARDGTDMASSPQYGVFGVAKGGVDDLTFEVMVHYEP